MTGDQFPQRVGGERALPESRMEGHTAYTSCSLIRQASQASEECAGLSGELNHCKPGCWSGREWRGWSHPRQKTLRQMETCP